MSALCSIPELPKSKARCAVSPDRTYKVEHKTHVAEFASLSTGQSNPSWVSKAWLDDWKKDKPIMHEEGTDSDPPPDDPAYFKGVLCPHGGLQPDEQGRVMITGRVSSSCCTSEVWPELIRRHSKQSSCKICFLSGSLYKRIREHVRSAETPMSSKYITGRK